MAMVSLSLCVSRLTPIASEIISFTVPEFICYN